MVTERDQPELGERRVSEVQRELEGFDRRRSAGLFVGINEFQDENLAAIPFAVDDAVDLAHLFLLELQLLHGANTVLCLSGSPRKEATAERLRRLEGEGVEVRTALQTEVYHVLERLGGRTNSKGLFLVAVASHGISVQGSDYLLAADSLKRRVERTGIAVAEVFDEMAQARAPRQILLLDACRERLTAHLRAGAAEAASAMSPSLEKAIGESRGQAILLGTTLGGYSYDDPEVRNGVFSSSILEGLKGEAGGDERDYITIRTLGEYVDQRVRRWVQRNRPEHAEVSRGITLHLEGAAAALPLAVAVPRPGSGPAPLARLGPYGRVVELLEEEDLGGGGSLGVHLSRLPRESLARLDELLRIYRLGTELRLARELRGSFASERPPELLGYELRYRQQTAPWPGGDVVGFEPLARERTLAYLGDVSGRGVAAAAGALLLKNSLESMARQGSPELPALVRSLNESLIRDAQAHRIYSLFVALLDSEGGRLEYVNAGHPPGLLAGRDGLRELPSTGPILGVLADAAFESARVELAPGDRLLLYTDGVMELENGEREEFGLGRLRDALAASPAGETGDALLGRLLAELEAFAAEGTPGDDQTLLTLRRLRA